MDLGLRRQDERFIIALFPSNRHNMDELKATLRELHRQLETAQGVDAESRDLLRALDADIHTLLLEESEEAPTDAEFLTERAQEVAARFASNHPQLEKLLREVADKLANIGI